MYYIYTYVIIIIYIYIYTHLFIYLSIYLSLYLSIYLGRRGGGRLRWASRTTRGSCSTRRSLSDRNAISPLGSASRHGRSMYCSRSRLAMSSSDLCREGFFLGTSCRRTSSGGAVLRQRSCRGPYRDFLQERLREANSLLSSVVFLLAQILSYRWRPRRSSSTLARLEDLRAMDIVKTPPTILSNNANNNKTHNNNITANKNNNDNILRGALSLRRRRAVACLDPIWQPRTHPRQLDDARLRFGALGFRTCRAWQRHRGGSGTLLVRRAAQVSEFPGSLSGNVPLLPPLLRRHTFASREGRSFLSEGILKPLWPHMIALWPIQSHRMYPQNIPLPSRSPGIHLASLGETPCAAASRPRVLPPGGIRLATAKPNTAPFAPDTCTRQRSPTPLLCMYIHIYIMYIYIYA